MLQYLEKETNITYTENDALTYASSLSDCLDLFSTVGAMRNAKRSEIQARFIKAYTENKDIATKILFFARDVRGGLGERRFFRMNLKWLAFNKEETIKKNLPLIPEYGRFDDLLYLINTPCENDALCYIKNQLDSDIKAMNENKEISLLAKWLPSINTSSQKTVELAKKVAKSLSMSDETYRKTLSSLRAYLKIIENNLREKDYSFDYEKQPSKALFKYRQAFIRNDKKRYNKFLTKVNNGEAKLNASNIMPYELVQNYIDKYSFCKLTKHDRKSINATWNSLADFTTNDNSIAVVDTSGSMYCGCKPSPASVALSLGIYFAEHNKGFFKDHFIMFSEKPKLIKLKGETFLDKLRYICNFNEVANTNIEAVFNLILDTAVNNNLPQSELPEKIYLISDMKFDCAVENADLTNFELAKKNFEEKGYKLPTIIFWNVASRKLQQPTTKDESGAVLVSGCTPRLFSMVASGEINPMKFMMQVLNSERYAEIFA